MLLIDGSKLKIWYPDFTLPEHKIIIEFLGMKNDASYDERTKHKREAYQENFIGCIFIDNKYLVQAWEERLVKDIGMIMSLRYGKFQEFLRT